MIALVFVACIVTTPAQCREQHRTYADLSLMGCMMGAQAVMAEWKASRPGWRIARWSCQPVRAKAQRI